MLKLILSKKIDTVYGRKHLAFYFDKTCYTNHGHE